MSLPVSLANAVHIKTVFGIFDLANPYSDSSNRCSSIQRKTVGNGHVTLFVNKRLKLFEKYIIDSINI